MALYPMTTFLRAWGAVASAARPREANPAMHPAHKQAINRNFKKTFSRFVFIFALLFRESFGTFAF
jgi:hypothetical protein